MDITRLFSLFLALTLAACGPEKDTGSDPDDDGDGFGESTDCNDADPHVNPDAEEICDGMDNNCDGNIDEGVATTYYADQDGDAYGSAADTVDACTLPSGYLTDDSDCDDSNAEVNPAANEICDEQDNNCNGETDEGVSTVFYADADGDGWGADSPTTTGCTVPSGYADQPGDCNDGVATIHPDAAEYCDGVDNDCDEALDEEAIDAFIQYDDHDRDGFGDDATMQYLCERDDSLVLVGGDCDDHDSMAYPGAEEYCDGEDNDCDGITDPDDALDTTTWYEDADRDGYGDPDSTAQACDAPSGFVDDNTDCDDTDRRVYPGNGCGFESDYISWAFYYGLLGGVPSDVTSGGTTYSPLVEVWLLDDAYFDAYDEQYICLLYYDVTMAAGSTDGSAWQDWDFQNLTFSGYDGDGCETLDTALWGSDPYTTIGELAAISITIEAMSADTESSLSSSTGWATMEPYYVGGTMYLDGADYGMQTHFGYARPVDDAGEIDTTSYLESADVGTGEDGYFVISPLYVFGLT